MADLRGTLIHTGRDRSPDPAPRDATGPVQDPFLRVLGPRQEDEEDAEIALDAMEADEEEARVIAATAVMTIGAGAEAVDGVGVADVSEGTLDFCSVGVWDDKKNCNIDFKIPMTPVLSAPATTSHLLRRVLNFDQEGAIVASRLLNGTLLDFTIVNALTSSLRFLTSLLPFVTYRIRS